MTTDLSRRRFLQAAAAAAAATAVDLPASASASADGAARTVSLSFTAATDGSATLAPSGDVLVAEVQSVLWSIPREGGEATALTPPDLEPTRPVFSPDGRTLAVCAYRDGVFHIWTLRPDGSGLRRLTDGPFDDRGPAWSPDGTHIAFASERGGDPTLAVAGSPYRIWMVNVGSGELTQLTGLPGQDGPLQGGAWEDFDPAWSPDGRRLYFARGTLNSAGSLQARTIAAVPADGSGAVVTEHTDDGPAAATLMAPAVSPTGRLAYLRTTASPASSCTLVVDGAPVDVQQDVAPVPPRWIAPGELLINAGGQFRLLRPEAPGDATSIPFTATLPVNRPSYRVKRYDFDLTDGKHHDIRSVQQPALSPDGRQVAFLALNALWTAPVSGRGTPRKIVQAAPLRLLTAPAWTQDSRALLYAHDRDGLFAVYRHDLTTGEESLLATGGRMFPALSPDGERLATFDVSGNLMITTLSTGEERILVKPSGSGVPSSPSWSPDGRYLAYCDCTRLSWRFREGYNLISIVNTDSGATTLHALAPHVSLSDRYASGPVWSPNGQWLAVVADSALWLLPVAADGTPTGAARQLTTEAADHPSWSGDSRTILYLSAGTLRTISADGGRPRTVPVSLGYRRPRAQDTVLHAGRLWDGTGDTVRDDVDILIRDGRITAVEPHRAGRPAARHIDAAGKTVIPGLWDCHTHFQTKYGGRQTALYLAYGITTAVSMGSFAYEQAGVRESIASGNLAGPRILTSGEVLEGSRAYYTVNRTHHTLEGLRRSLARGEALGWDFVKTYVRAPSWIMAEAAAFAQERLGVRSGSHLCVPGIHVGQDLTSHLQATQRLEYGHATSATGRACQDLVELYTAAGADFHMIATPFTAGPLVGEEPSLADDPRVTTLMPPWDVTTVRQNAAKPPTADQLAALDRETAIYRRILDAGGLVVLGTDQPVVVTGLPLHLALRALHRAGLSVADTLRMATVLPARVFGADDLGTLTEGKLADAVIVDGDPFTNFDTLVRTVSVLRGGVPFNQSDLIDAFDGEAAGAQFAERDQDHWREVSRQMHQESCCG